VVDTTIEASLSPAVGTITPRQPGMMDLVWTGDRYGVIWVHEDITTGCHPWFFELQADVTDSITRENLREDTTNTHHPAVTWVDLGGDEECFVFAWTQFDSSDAQHKLFTYSYCCTI